MLMSDLKISSNWDAGVRVPSDTSSIRANARLGLLMSMAISADAEREGLLGIASAGIDCQDVKPERVYEGVGGGEAERSRTGKTVS